MLHNSAPVHSCETPFQSLPRADVCTFVNNRYATALSGKTYANTTSQQLDIIVLLITSHNADYLSAVSEVSNLAEQAPIGYCCTCWGT